MRKRSNPIVLMALGVGWLLGPGGFTRGAVQTANPTSDTFVSGANTGNNYGAAGAMDMSAPGLTNGEYQGLLKFNLAVAKTSFDTEYGAGQWTIQSITLQLTSANPNNAIFNANAAGAFNISWMQSDAWVEGTGNPAGPTADGVTFGTLPTFLSGADQSLGSFNSPGTNSGSNTFTLTLASSFLADANAGGEVSMRLFADSGSTSSYLFNSRSFGTAANRPLLTVTAMPEPISCGLIAIASIILFSRNRKLPSCA